MPDNRPTAELREGITGQFELVTEIVRVRSGDRLTVTKHTFTFRDGLLVAVSEPQQDDVEIPEIPPPFAAG